VATFGALHRHGNYLTVVAVIKTPSPYGADQEFRLRARHAPPPYPCDIVVEIARERGYVLTCLEPMVPEGYAQEHSLPQTWCWAVRRRCTPSMGDVEGAKQ
jgi:hypothetical protein